MISRRDPQYSVNLIGKVRQERAVARITVAPSGTPCHRGRPSAAGASSAVGMDSPAAFHRDCWAAGTGAVRLHENPEVRLPKALGLKPTLLT